MGGIDAGTFNEIAAYYEDKFFQHGDTPLGVDWNGKESQTVRFAQLCQIIDPKLPSFSLNDLGCGYGALLDYLQDRHASYSYLGVDISKIMIKSAEQRFADVRNARFIVSGEPDSVADYGVASGILNVSLGFSDEEWFDYAQTTLDVLDRTSSLGFSFNLLSSYCDAERKQKHLFYANPANFFDLCKRRYSRQVALLHDYGLYEFTVLVRKS